MKRLLATVLLSAVALLALAAGSASAAACLPPYCGSPTATTGSAFGVSSFGATLAGTINPNSSATTYYFEFGVSQTNLDRQSPQGTLPADTQAHNVSVQVGNLTPGTLYYYRVVATNAGGTVPGSIQVVGTPNVPPPAPEPQPEPQPQPSDPIVISEPQTNPKPEDPTPAQAKESRNDAADEVGVPVVENKKLDLGPALAFVPGGGNDKDRPADVPKVSGDTASFNRQSLQDGQPQTFMAVGCPTVDCKASFELEVVITDKRGKKTTIKLPAQTLDIAQGGTGVLKLNLPMNIRRALLKGGQNIQLKVGVTIDSPAGVVADAKTTYKLNAPKSKAKPKSSKRG